MNVQRDLAFSITRVDEDCSSILLQQIKNDNHCWAHCCISAGLFSPSKAQPWSNIPTSLNVCGFECAESTTMKSL